MLEFWFVFGFAAALFGKFRIALAIIVFWTLLLYAYRFTFCKRVMCLDCDGIGRHFTVKCGHTCERCRGFGAVWISKSRIIPGKTNCLDLEHEDTN
jgi:hypothetical protein